MKKVVMGLGILVVLMLSIFPLVSAGVGVSWNKETALIPEKSDVCLTYGVYNPWPKDSYIKIKLSDSLKEIVESSDAKVDSIPKYTYSNSSIPVKFCFRTPDVYKEDCLLFDKFLCKQTCSEPIKIYSGELEVLEVNEATVKSGGSGGSSTSMSVSAPLRVKVQCLKHARNYSLIYLLVGLIALLILIWRIYVRKKGKRKK